MFFIELINLTGCVCLKSLFIIQTSGLCVIAKEVVCVWSWAFPVTKRFVPFGLKPVSERNYFWIAKRPYHVKRFNLFCNYASAGNRAEVSATARVRLDASARHRLQVIDA